MKVPSSNYLTTREFPSGHFLRSYESSMDLSACAGKGSTKFFLTIVKMSLAYCTTSLTAEKNHLAKFLPHLLT